MVDYRRSHTCGELTLAHVQQTVTLSGWVHRRRNLGGLLFLELRDRFGRTQLFFDPEKAELFAQASQLRNEWVICIKGVVTAKAESNPKLRTGQIEVYVQELTILSPAKTPPISLNEEEEEAHEELRLKYRYLDIRRGSLCHNLEARHRAMLLIRNYFSELGFLEITTPILAKSTPEGARDYLVPSRIYPGNFYALPQSPQLFKQLLMVGGMDRYFQIATCFRDEDLRADRQPEFTQVDVEMSFATQEDLLPLIEGLMGQLFKKILHKELPQTFPRISYKDCIEHYGSDRPDLRFGMPLVRIDTIAKESSFPPFQDQLANKGCVKALCVKGGASLSRNEIDRYIQFVSQFGLKGLSWVKIQNEGISSSINKFFSQTLLEKLCDKMGAEKGDLLLLAAAPEEKLHQALDHLRRKLAKDHHLIDPEAVSPLWVTDFPLLKWNEEEQRLESEHHPFTSPHPDDLPLLDTSPLKARALAYDLVINGYEVGGGSQRIHQSELQEKIFTLLQLSAGEIKEKFGFFVEALQYGTPPHLGLALGLDRLIMILCHTENIRDVVAFPKTQKASDLMMQSPSQVHPRQLQELKVTAHPVEIPWI